MNLDFPQPPAKLHLIGIGGIGMSALAQFLVSLGYQVSGSDRDLSTPAQVKLFNKLKSQGIKIFLQDGSGVQEFQPTAIIYSSAIEESNPDFAAATGIPRFHRSMAMAISVNRSGMKQIAVAGSCGKTSVTGWLSSALQALGENPVMINGGYTGEFISESQPGNFKAGEAIIVYEADESDGSLVNFRPDCALLLNLGVDHYEKEKLDELFREFLGNSQLAVVSNQLQYLVPEDKKHFSFTENIKDKNFADYTVSKSESTPEGIHFSCGDVEIKTQQFGNHSAANALAVFSTLVNIGYKPQAVAAALSSFEGVDRRFDFRGLRGNKRIYDDYAHNVQKIAACIETAQGLADQSVIAVFQPHGYGPLGFMRDALKEELQKVLTSRDQFVFLPVFYAGGSTSFKPDSAEVTRDYKQAGLSVIHLSEREELADYLDQQIAPATVVILGARDPSLADWSSSLTEPQK